MKNMDKEKSEFVKDCDNKIAEISDFLKDSEIKNKDKGMIGEVKKIRHLLKQARNLVIEYERLRKVY